METAFDKKKLIGLVASIVAFFIIFLIPDIAGLSHEGKTAIALLVAGIIAWVTQCMPLCISGLLMMFLLPYLGVLPDFDTVYSKFISSTLFFVIGCYGFTAALQNSEIPARAVGFIMRWSKGNSKKVVFGFMVFAALLSMVCSNIASCAMLMSFCLALFEANGSVKGESNFAKCLLLGIVFSVGLGGGMLICGTAVNPLLVGMIEQNFGITVTFLDWAKMGIPMGIIMVPLTYFIITRICKPEDIKQEAIDQAVKAVEAMGPVKRKDITKVVVILVVLLLWILSSWIPALNTTVVAIIGLIIMFLPVPGLSLITWKEYNESMSWDTIVLMGAVTAVAAGLTATGAASWMVGLVASGDVSPLMALLLGSVIAGVIHMVVPIGPAVVGLLAIPLVGLAGSAGLAVAPMMIVISWWASSAYMVPLDCVCLVTLGYGYYTMGEHYKIGVGTHVLMIIYTVTILPLTCMAFGLW